jgi:hypothetical protein
MSRIIGVDLHEDIRLNPFNLEAEVQDQPLIYKHYADQAADARKERDLAADRVDVRSAEIELDLRADTSLGKLTESGIKSRVIAHPEIQTLTQKLRDANNWMMKCDGILHALDHKKSEIDNVVDMWKNGLYQDPMGRGTEESTASQVRKGLNPNKGGSNAIQ